MKIRSLVKAGDVKKLEDKAAYFVKVPVIIRAIKEKQHGLQRRLEYEILSHCRLQDLKPIMNLLQRCQSSKR